ncbi:cytochrome c maturation protein CcmE [Pelagibius litoralis]|uniref:Cytochrome c-type biogenesis protein CcmE n=1 Tax=Pelagibius litoralis TaxID=374515 RepID=A0A967KIF3_9PROT|nr:cytochrome c maturation protein CcmE [Pelagibius litoralis]NIA72226.1 cytochrome c maturation protein CcmE [Pelagibius litoralis]
MTRKRRRLYILSAALLIFGGAAALVLTALDENLDHFRSPTQLIAEPPAPERGIRLGGLVEEGTVERSVDGLSVTFRVTDLAESVAVSYTGILPDLFREGQGVVTTGSLLPDGTFAAREVLAKHDETYMPREVVDALKASGQWRDDETGHSESLTQ